MNTKHTPGPWRHDKRGYPHPDVKAANGRNVACTWGVNNQPKTTAAAKTQMQIARANARLIAAAPELLEALIDCVSLLAFLEPEVRGGYSPDGALSKARAVIAKATGEQQ